MRGLPEDVPHGPRALVPVVAATARCAAKYADTESEIAEYASLMVAALDNIFCWVDLPEDDEVEALRERYVDLLDGARR